MGGGTTGSDGLRHRIGILGNPQTPEARFDDGQLARLAALGFTAVQLNIAWGSRPPKEPLNLEDVLPLPGQAEAASVTECREELRRRARQAHKHGLRTLFHFGAPHVKGLYRQFREKNLEKSQAVEACLLLPEIPRLYGHLVARLAEVCPEIDDILVYTYDQEAWLCSEFGDCPRCHGVPLHDRLPAFLQVLRDAWASARPEGTVWWEPWELSAGQTLMMANRVPNRNFGLMLHTNIAEVQAAHPVDPWFRNMTRLCAKRGIPVVGELFLASATEEVQPFVIPAPRLVHQALTALRGVSGVVGAKEYFGLLPDRADPNLEMAGQVFVSPGIGLDAALAAIAAPYGDGRGSVLEAWHAAASGLELFPWDVCWKLRNIGRRISAWHDWKAYRLPGHLVDSPSWCSTRRALFMTTENDALHPWFYEDMGLRCQLSAETLDAAAAACEQARAQVPASLRAAVESWASDLLGMRRCVRSYQCHIHETLLAQHVRDALASGRPTDPLVERLRAMLRLDADNQRGAPPGPADVPAAAAMLAEFDASPTTWVRWHLLDG